MKRDWLSWIAASVLFGLLGFAGSIALQPRHYRGHPGDGGIQNGHALLLACYSYANDNDGNYPDGKSSLEVCQKLMAGGYAADPSLFFLPLPGKKMALPGQELKPENICWDFTGGATLKDSGSLPVLFSTGYRVTYAPGAAAILRTKTVPQYQTWPRTWYEWWHGQPILRTEIYFEGIQVVYVNNSTQYMPLKPLGNSVEGILGFVPVDFDAKGKTYRQLTPDGVLAP